MLVNVGLFLAVPPSELLGPGNDSSSFLPMLGSFPAFNYFTDDLPLELRRQS